MEDEKIGCKECAMIQKGDSIRTFWQQNIGLGFLRETVELCGSLGLEVPNLVLSIKLRFRHKTQAKTYSLELRIRSGFWK